MNIFKIMSVHNGTISDKRLMVNSHQPVEMEEELILKVVKWFKLQLLEASTFAAPTAKLAVTSSKKLTRLLGIALIAVSFLIDAQEKEDSSSGKPSVSCKHTLSSTAPSLDAISAIDQSFST